MKWYRRFSFKTRVFLGCLLMALVPLTFSSVVMMRLFTASINCQITMDGNQQLEGVRGQFTQLLENCQKVRETLIEDGFTAWVMVDNKTIEFQEDLYLPIYQVVQEICSHTQSCTYNADGKLCLMTGTAPKSSRLPVNQGLLDKVSEGQGVTYCRADPYLPSSDSDALIQGVFSPENTHGARTGYVILNFTRENFDNLLNSLHPSGNTLLTLGFHQRPLYCSRSEHGEREISDIIGHIISGQGGTEKKGAYTEHLWTKELPQGFYILLCRPAPIGVPAVRTMGMVNPVPSGPGLVLHLLTTGASSRNIGQPASLSDKAMVKVKKGDLPIRICTSRRDKLGGLMESFNQMIENLQKYLDDTVQKQKDLDKATLRPYQTQLNPHSLYDTPDSIKWDVEISQMFKIMVLVENLAVILRESIFSRFLITLREELRTIESYVEMQEICFTGQFLYETEISDQLEDRMVPKMISQPLVENVIIHGLDGCERGYVCIYAFQKEGILNISMIGSGCGMSRGMADWTNSGAPTKRDGRLGLYSVINILKIYYGQEYDMETAVTEDGTTVILRLSVQKEALDV